MINTDLMDSLGDSLGDLLTVPAISLGPALLLSPLSHCSPFINPCHLTVMDLAVKILCSCILFHPVTSIDMKPSVLTANLPPTMVFDYLFFLATCDADESDCSPAVHFAPRPFRLPNPVFATRTVEWCNSLTESLFVMGIPPLIVWMTLVRIMCEMSVICLSFNYLSSGRFLPFSNHLPITVSCLRSFEWCHSLTESVLVMGNSCLILLRSIVRIMHEMSILCLSLDCREVKCGGEN
jgi:hypothetical protein